MKLKKILAGFAATVLALTMMMGTAMATTDVLPFEYPNEANVATDNDVWVKLIGGGNVISTADVSAKVRSVDVTITGNATFDAEFIYNYDGGWVPTTYPGQTVNGKLVLTMPMDGSQAPNWCEIIVNLKNKSEGPLTVAMMEFKDENGNVLVTHGYVAEDTAETAATSTPKTGVVTYGAVYGLAAALFASGAVALRRKQK